MVDVGRLLDSGTHKQDRTETRSGQPASRINHREASRQLNTECLRSVPVPRPLFEPLHAAGTTFSHTQTESSLRRRSLRSAVGVG